MPYYRIVVWTKRRKLPYKGIRLLAEHNINSAFNMVQTKAKQLYKQDYLDCEVQQLSKLCSAVKTFEMKEQRTK